MCPLLISACLPVMLSWSPFNCQLQVHNNIYHTTPHKIDPFPSPHHFHPNITITPSPLPTYHQLQLQQLAPRRDLPADHEAAEQQPDGRLHRQRVAGDVHVRVDLSTFLGVRAVPAELHARAEEKEGRRPQLCQVRDRKSIIIIISSRLHFFTLPLYFKKKRSETHYTYK